jgi:hypothetical protein
VRFQARLSVTDALNTNIVVWRCAIVKYDDTRQENGRLHLLVVREWHRCGVPIAIWDIPRSARVAVWNVVRGNIAWCRARVAATVIPSSRLPLCERRLNRNQESSYRQKCGCWMVDPYTAHVNLPRSDSIANGCQQARSHLIKLLRIELTKYHHLLR